MLIDFPTDDCDLYSITEEQMLVIHEVRFIIHLALPLGQKRLQGRAVLRSHVPALRYCQICV